MNNRLRNRLIIVIVLFTVIFIPALIALDYLNSTKDIKINYKNSHGIEIHDITEEQEGKGNSVKRAATVKKSGENIRLKKDGSYIVSYKGNDGFSDGHETIDMTKNNVTINPYYSKSKLTNLLNNELDDIQSTLSQKYSRIDLYKVQKGELYHFGEWYGTTLQYIGEDDSNSDTLRVILNKKGGEWKVVTDPPNISLDKFTYPNIPHDILSSVNNELEAPLINEPASEGGARFAP